MQGHLLVYCGSYYVLIESNDCHFERVERLHLNGIAWSTQVRIGHCSMIIIISVHHATLFPDILKNAWNYQVL